MLIERSRQWQIQQVVHYIWQNVTHYVHVSDKMVKQIKQSHNTNSLRKSEKNTLHKLHLHLPGWNAMSAGRNIQRFQRNLLHLSLGHLIHPVTWKHKIPLKYQYASTWQHHITSQKITVFKE